MSIKLRQKNVMVEVRPLVTTEHNVNFAVIVRYHRKEVHWHLTQEELMRIGRLAGYEATEHDKH